jgi:hypothetical protein
MTTNPPQPQSHTEVVRILMSCGIKESDAKAAILRLEAEGIVRITPEWDVEAAATNPPQPQRSIDGKFSTDGTRIFNTVSGETIPDDEPLFLLRGRDAVALRAITAYLNECEEYGCNDLHLAGIQQARQKFTEFAINHPQRMKQPGVTKHLKLEAVSGKPAEPTPQISHDRARNSAQRFIDEHFNNEPKYGRVQTRIPADRTDDDITLMEYINQQEAASLRSPRPASDYESLLREIDKWCSGENQVDDGEDAEDALKYIRDAIRAFLAAAPLAEKPQPEEQ